MHKDKFNEEFSFPIYEDIADLPFGEHPSVLKEGVAGICLEGSATVEIFERRCPVVKNNLLVLFPYVQTSLKDVSGDFRIRFFKVSADFFNDIMSGLVNMTLEFYFYMLCHCTHPLNENEAFPAFSGTYPYTCRISFGIPAQRCGAPDAAPYVL